MVKILNDRQIAQKIQRLAIEIAEQNWENREIFLLGINNNGHHFASILREAVLAYHPEFTIHIHRLKLNPADPIGGPAHCDFPIETFTNQSVILVDDVANTGRTLFYAFQPLMAVIPKQVQIAVLVERHHKTFPVHVDYVGIRLATTLHEHIQVELNEPGKRAVFLD